MSNYVTLSAIGAGEPDFSALPKNFSAYEKAIKEYLKQQIDTVLPDNPDLIIFPEDANRFTPRTDSQIRDYYKYLGDSIVEFLKPIAVEHNTNIAYSAVRYTDTEGTHPFRNSTVYVGRDGQICGIYDKNHPFLVEYENVGVGYGTEAQVIKLDFGTVANAICFDLNFDELLYKYKPQKPDLIVFCSMYHGGVARQTQWAYTCRSYFVSAVCDMPCNILNPYGTVVAASTNYTKHVSARVNLDYALCHLDFNGEKLAAAKQKYKEGLSIYDPGYVGSFMLTSEIPGKSVKEIMAEFELDPLDTYLERMLAHRAQNV